MADPTAGDESPINLSASVEDSQANAKGPNDESAIKYWMREISDARDREKTWRKEAFDCVDLYEAVKKKDYQYNVLYSNTETFAPALYNQVPRPVVSRRFKDADPLGKICSEVVKRLISFVSDSGDCDYPSFDSTMTQAVLEALVPGRGITRFKHEVEFAEVGIRDNAEKTPEEKLKAGEQDNQPEPPDQEIAYETVVSDCIPWDRFTHGYAKQWRHVPWIAIDHYMTREELCQNFGKAIGVQIKLTETEKESEEGSPADDKWSKKRDDQKGVKMAIVHEIWDKNTRKVMFISPGMPLKILRTCDDPLELDGFFPMPEPLKFFRKIKTLVPTTLYAQYQEQARELNRITVRINRIIGACKVRGFYDKRVNGIERMLQQDDNTLLPAENITMIGDQAVDLDKLIWMQPLDKLVAALQTLYNQREQIKMVIYDITGVADIMRGASKASETLGAQQLKEQWGSLRLSRMQKMVQDYARECFRLMAEIAVNQLSQDTIAKITGLQYPTQAQKEQAQAQLAQAQQLIAQQAQAQPAPQQQVPGQPPAPQQQQPQIPPQLAQSMQQLQAILAKPSWEDILKVLGDTLTRNYRIDIETNSTVDPEASEDKQNITDLLAAIGQFFQMIGPLVMEGAIPMDAAKGILMTSVRRFKFGPDIEDYLDMLKAPQPKPDPKAQAAQAQAAHEQQMSQIELQQAQTKAQTDSAKAQQDLQIAQVKHQMELEKLAFEQQKSKQEHELEIQRITVESQAKLLSAQAQLRIAASKSREANNPRPSSTPTKR